MSFLTKLLHTHDPQCTTYERLWNLHGTLSISLMVGRLSSSTPMPNSNSLFNAIRFSAAFESWSLILSFPFNARRFREASRSLKATFSVLIHFWLFKCISPYFHCLSFTCSWCCTCQTGRKIRSLTLIWNWMHKIESTKMNSFVYYLISTRYSSLRW